MKKRYICFWIVYVTAVSLFIGKIAVAGSSGSKPAVSDINAKVSAGCGDLDAASAVFGTASVTIPVTHSFGFAADVLGGDYSADSLWGVGGNLFWRNPNKGLVGIIGSDVQVGSAKVWRTGVAGESYLGQFSVIGDIGYQAGDMAKHSMFSDLGCKWYAYDNLALGVGGAYSGKDIAGVASIEYMPAQGFVPGLAFFLNGSIGESDYSSVIVGIRYYFGKENKTLKQRHREDDPENGALNGLFFGSQAGFANKPEPIVATIEEDEEEGPK